jgi:hypothetical protein
MHTAVDDGCDQQRLCIPKEVGIDTVVLEIANL